MALAGETACYKSYDGRIIGDSFKKARLLRWTQHREDSFSAVPLGA